MPPTVVKPRIDRRKLSRLVDRIAASRGQIAERQVQLDEALQTRDSAIRALWEQGVSIHLIAELACLSPARAQVVAERAGPLPDRRQHRAATAAVRDLMP